MRILIIEDDDHGARASQSALRERGYEVVRTSTGAEPLTLRRNGASPDLILLDLGRAGTDSARLVVALRSKLAVPVIVLTTRSDVASRVGALRAGADDYITKPFWVDELTARVEAVLRRSSASRPAADALEIGDVQIHFGARSVTTAGARIALTRKEFDILATLADAAGSVVDRQRLLMEVWGTDWLGMSRTLEVHVATLRSKVGRPALVETVRGIGYRLGTAHAA